MTLGGAAFFVYTRGPVACMQERAHNYLRPRCVLVRTTWACARSDPWEVRTGIKQTEPTTTHGDHAVGSTSRRLSPRAPAPSPRRCDYCRHPRTTGRRQRSRNLRRRCRALDQAMQKQNSLSLSIYLSIYLSISGCLPVQCSGDDQALSWQAL